MPMRQPGLEPFSPIGWKVFSKIIDVAEKGIRSRSKRLERV